MAEPIRFVFESSGGGHQPSGSPPPRRVDASGNPVGRVPRRRKRGKKRRGRARIPATLAGRAPKLFRSLRGTAGFAARMGVPGASAAGGMLGEIGGISTAGGVAGVALGAVAVGAVAVKAAFDAVHSKAMEFAASLGKYSADVSMAQAEGDVNKIMADIQRAQLLGPELADFTRAQNRFEVAKDDAMAALIKPLLPMVTGILEFLTEAVKWIEAAINGVVDAINEVIGAIEKGINALPGVEVQLARLVRNTTPREGPAQGDFLTQLLGVGRLNFGMDEDQAIQMRGQALNIPVAQAALGG